MKRCPTCQRTYTDEVKFCRVDGVTLVNASAELSESEATRVLPGSRATGEAPTEVFRNTGEAKLTTSALKPGAAPAAIGAPRKSMSRRKLALIIFLFVVIAIVVASYVFYRHARDSEVAIDSIAVLPFENQNRDPNIDYLSDGITESITNNLTQLQNLRVIPSTSVSHYKRNEIVPLAAGKELGVRAILTGRIMQRGENLTISTTLVDVRDNKQVWGERYERKLADVLAVQQEISREITERLRLKLSGEEQRQLTKRDTANPEAYQFYLKGRYYWNKRTIENLKKAIEQFQQAADRDPNYALAYVGLADCYSLLEIYAGTPAGGTHLKAKAFAQRALQLDGSLAEAHTSLAFADTSLWQWEEAEAEFKRAIKLDPNYPTAHQWYSTLLRDMGRLDESLAETKRAQQLDPLSLIIGQNLAMAYLSLGDVTSAIEQSKRVIDLDLAFPRGYWTLGLAYLKQGRHSEAIAALQKAVELSGGEREMLSHLGYGYAISGKGSAALAILKEVQGKYQKHEALAQDVAAIYAGLGDKDQAFAWLEKDFETSSGQLARVRWEPPFESLRSDPRFADLLRRMRLKP